LLALLLCVLCAQPSLVMSQTRGGARLTTYVDPFIGADGGGNTVPGAAADGGR
jgi:hypothetical protein